MSLLKITVGTISYFEDSANIEQISYDGTTYSAQIGGRIYEGATAISEIGVQVVATGANNVNLNTVLTERSLIASAGDSAATADTVA